ncbi:tRNA uridine-5-carboxymethylaminomethyl(34) synthesis GTPase MnmE [Desulfoferrobacter suflitae]|uniref:tRNA uridine-5-carboxymethylaminomethyl(34) synthesis GTPase MnmE n=1 Tax=Desulfoferrobacter suflitae TaxID=2865782 RepID=UPI0021648DA8|nr:tRNA uridine-5-carboxymethylaminomethyl(34) synthesis GTPase MnmE [Desulfoferrobacter suflitae]MCK8601122.1 tRNA uridine-5-carboxymethylaminomethyl(34) synthesis GTPase MnmE [Desulfoferrobacter suflitae]
MDFELTDDTISAIATPIGQGGIGIVKISGTEALSIAKRIFRPRKSVHAYETHKLYHGWIVEPETQEVVDEVLLSYMAGPRTYTREDMVEINCHSGFMVLNRIMEFVLQSGARLAEPGEFTRRAFLNGRIDLSQAEAVADLIHSRSQQSLLAAARHLSGDFRSQIDELRDKLWQLQSEIEAFIDFGNDLDEGEANIESVKLLLTMEESLIRPLGQILACYETGRLLREGLTLVLVGKPNVGKSSLLNVLLGKDRAIVTSMPGTTRDIIEDSFRLSGVLIRILDTAGIRMKPDSIESMGIQRTLSAVAEADIILWLMDQSQPLSEEDDQVFQAVSGKSYMILLNKCDLPPRLSVEDIRTRYDRAVPVLRISVFNRGDIEGLQNFLRDRFLATPLAENRSALIPNMRQKECCERSLEALQRGRKLLQTGSYNELVSLEIETARKHLNAVLGLEVDQDLLDGIFSRFCIGK